jgi:hypothetical protein
MGGCNFSILSSYPVFSRSILSEKSLVYLRRGKMRKVTVISIMLTALILFGCDFFDSNEPPVIEKIEANKTKADLGDIVLLNVIATDPDGDELTYEYEVSMGSIVNSGSIVSWRVDEVDLELEVGESLQFAKVTVSDGDKSDQESITITVVKGTPPCTLDIDMETWTTTPSGVIDTGRISVYKDGMGVGNATVEVENMTSGETGSTQTNSDSSSGTPVGFAMLGEVGLPDIRVGDVVKVIVTYAGESCVGCYIAGAQSMSGGYWEKIECP